VKRKILIVGRLGQVGWELCRTLACLGDVAAIDRPEIELTDIDAVRGLITDLHPAVVVNAAAYTAVDLAERESGVAMQINAAAPIAMAEECKKAGALFVTYSTDYVFDGSKNGAYTEGDTPSPQNTYGRTKLAGDLGVQAVDGSYLIFRTSWVYGSRGKNFLLTMLKLAEEREELKVVDDQIGSPTWSRAIAESTALVLSQLLSPGRLAGRTTVAEAAREFSGVYNLTAGGQVSWCGFAREIFSYLSAKGKTRVPTVIPILTAEYPTPATRPMNSVLNNEKVLRTFNVKMPRWEECLALVMDELGNGAI